MEDRPNSLYRVFKFEPPYAGTLTFRSERGNRLTTLTVEAAGYAEVGVKPFNFYLSDGELHTLIEYLTELEEHLNAP